MESIPWDWSVTSATKSLLTSPTSTTRTVRHFSHFFIFLYIEIPQKMKILVSLASLKFAILTRPLTPPLLSVLMDRTR